MRTALATLALVVVAGLPACGTGGIRPQPPGLGKPWFETHPYVIAYGVNPGNWTYGSSSTPWYACFVPMDANQDGHLDLVLVSENATQLMMPSAWVMLGDGDFHFGLNGYPWADCWTRRRWAAAGDFDGDGWLDLVATDTTIPGVKTIPYYGGATGISAWGLTLEAVVTATPPGKIVSGDWDEDGKLDAAYLVPGLDIVFLLRGNGDATLGNTFPGPTLPLATGGDPLDLLAADLDGDGHLDLATANRGGDSVSVFLGNGDGGFATQPLVAAPGGPRALAAGDFNGDGRMDLATAGFDFSFGVGGAASGRDQIDILLAEGRTWALALDSFVPLEDGEQPVDLVAADFDGDGDVDLAYISRTLQAVGTLENDGQAAFTFTNPARISLGHEPKQLEIGDFDDDDDSDLAVLLPNSNTVVVLENIVGN